MLSLPHLILIFIIALIAFGPEKLPQLARTLGKAMAEFRKVTTDLRRVVEDEMREIDRQARDAELHKRQAQVQALAPPPGSPGAASDPVLPEHSVITGQSAEPTIAPPGTVPAAAPQATHAESVEASSKAEQTGFTAEPARNAPSNLT
jgi:sec-independent protein translocase protein TatB